MSTPFLEDILTKNTEIDTVLDNLLTKNTALETLITAGNVDLAALEVLITLLDTAQDLTNTKLTTIDAVLDAILAEASFGYGFAKTTELYITDAILTIANNKRARLIGGFFKSVLQVGNTSGILISLDNGADVIQMAESPAATEQKEHNISCMPGVATSSLLGSNIILPCLGDWLKPQDAESGIQFQFTSPQAIVLPRFLYEVES